MKCLSTVPRRHSSRRTNPASVGPIIQGRVTQQDRADLASCYRSCLELVEGKDYFMLVNAFRAVPGFDRDGVPP